MKHAIADPLDSNCYATPLDAEGPTDEVCGEDATTFAYLRNGARRYLCEAHAEEVDRFGDTDDPHPAIVECKRCQRPTPLSKVGFDGICQSCQQ